ncbi:MAG: DNA-directed RNA polymerase subunit omega [Chitinophagaceae bacterium]|nr:DNA-directed RNA polymerase subunit omega [Chitinophagaceae bacterium]
MNHNKIKADNVDIANITGNIFESIVIIAMRARQIEEERMNTLKEKISGYQEPNSDSPSTERKTNQETNELLEIYKMYEKMPKSYEIAIEEFLKGKVYYRKTEQ